MTAPSCTIEPMLEGGVVVGECVSCPEIPEIVGRAGYTIVDPLFGWNSSALSVTQRFGDVYTEFTLMPSVGVAVGLTSARRSNDPAALPHAIIGYRESAKPYWSVMEYGAIKFGPVLHLPDDDLFRIERRGDTVRYFFNGRQVYASTLPSRGGLIVVACMFAAGDGVN